MFVANIGHDVSHGQPRVQAEDRGLRTHCCRDTWVSVRDRAAYLVSGQVLGLSARIDYLTARLQVLEKSEMGTAGDPR